MARPLRNATLGNLRTSFVTRDLRQAHSRLSGLIGPGAEPLEVLARAEEHRSYWKPERARVVLLAESHVYTEASELASDLRPVAGGPSDLPRGFVRLVYAIGYGENESLTRPIDSPPNKGTPQFWKIFQNCVRHPRERPNHALVQRTGNPDVRNRIDAKLRVLSQLRDRGVWLVDASIAALYLPGRPKPAARLRESVLQASWDSFTSGVVEAAEPEAVLCIGVGVMRALESRLNRLGIPWSGVHQPQAHLSADEHDRILSTYAEVCTDPRAISKVVRVE